MSVIGIDFGNDSCYVAVARQSGIETIDNDYSLRATPSCVGFGEKQRILGVAAKNQLITNLKNTVYDFKRFIGRKFDDPVCKDMASRRTYQVVEAKNRRAGVKVNYLGSEKVFSMEQVAAMLLTKLKQTTESAIGTKVSDCVVSCPSFFTNVEREAILTSCQMAGLNVLRLMNDTTASALTYAFYRQDLPEQTENARNVIFVDCGHSALQVFACAFNKGKMKMLATAADPHLGGRDFDNVLAEHFVGEFKKKYKLDASTNKRAGIRLLAEVEKLKKQMSANSTVLPINIESFMNDIDVNVNSAVLPISIESFSKSTNVNGTICRADFEAMCAPLLNRVQATLMQCLKDCGLTFEDIHSVEIIGGSSRIPAIKQLIENTFQKVPSTTLNQDEAVARGCAIQCATLSPTFRVKEISISDLQPYPIKLIFDPAAGSNGEMMLFPRFHPIPFSKLITLYRRDPFTLQVAYDSNTPFPDRFIGEYKINNVTPSPEGENTKIKIKMKLDINGIFSVRSAAAYEKAEEIEVPVPEPMDVENGNANGPAPCPENNGTANDANKTSSNTEGPNDAASDAAMDTRAPDTQTTGGVAEPTEEKKPVQTVKKQQYKAIALPFDTHTNGGINSGELMDLVDNEAQMVAQDRKEKDRIDVKNALEEYVYSLRDELDDEYRDFVSDSEKSKMVVVLGELAEWLYEEGEDQERSVYAQKLEELKKFGDGGKRRLEEEETKLNEQKQQQDAQKQEVIADESPVQPVTPKLKISELIKKVKKNLETYDVNSGIFLATLDEVDKEDLQECDSKHLLIIGNLIYYVYNDTRVHITGVRLINRMFTNGLIESKKQEYLVQESASYPYVNSFTCGLVRDKKPDCSIVHDDEEDDEFNNLDDMPIVAEVGFTHFRQFDFFVELIQHLSKYSKTIYAVGLRIHPNERAPTSNFIADFLVLKRKTPIDIDENEIVREIWKNLNYKKDEPHMDCGDCGKESNKKKSKDFKLEKSFLLEQYDVEMHFYKRITEADFPDDEFQDFEVPPLTTYQSSNGNQINPPIEKLVISGKAMTRLRKMYQEWYSSKNKVEGK